MTPVLVLATDSGHPSGLGEHMLTLGSALSDRFDVVIAAQPGPGGSAMLKRAAALGLRIKAFELGALDRFRIWLSAHATLLHVHAGVGWEGHDLVRIGKAAGLPVVRTEHLPYVLTSPVQQAEYGAMLLSVDRVVAVSRSAYDSYSSRHGASPFALVLNGIAAHSSSADRHEVRAALGLLAHEQLLLTVARFTAQKAYPTLLDAVPSVLERQPAARFVWVGDGPDFAAMQHAVRQADLGHAVTLLGQREDVPDLLAAADLLVLPSLFEGLPLVLLEAMVAGLPIVATQIGGSIEAVGTAHPYLSAPGDSPSLAATIISALGDPDAARSAGAAGRDRFKQHFSASRMAAQTADIYASVMATSSSPVQALSA
jgi:glycosyltransferase involved in cell wall biosynthesis